VGKISLVFMTVFLVAACMAEVKPILKPVEVDIPTRIANQQKWLEQDMKVTIPRDLAIPVQKQLAQIKENYDRLQSAGALTAKDIEAINRMLDETSEEIFRLNRLGRAK